ncbi:hypothetical protein MKW92_024442 [Papaver armeniacum]|nr:hypothetical protein MKW92_024442 [Papaver armeniacum]
MQLPLTSTSSSSVPWSSFQCKTLSYPIKIGTLCFQKKQLQIFCSSSNHNLINDVSLRKQEVKGCYEENLKRRGFILFFSSLSLSLVSGNLSVFAKTKSKSPYDENRLLEQNKRVQAGNNAPEDFPNFVREGFEVKVVTSDNYVKCDNGLIYSDIKVGQGDCPQDGFEQGIRDMRPGGKRRVIIPPDLGPPVGPSTFFSAKQFEVFDVELLSIQTCERRTILAFYSDLVCK